MTGKTTRPPSAPQNIIPISCGETPTTQPCSPVGAHGGFCVSRSFSKSKRTMITLRGRRGLRGWPARHAHRIPRVHRIQCARRNLLVHRTQLGGGSNPLHPPPPSGTRRASARHRAVGRGIQARAHIYWHTLTKRRRRVGLGHNHHPCATRCHPRRLHHHRPCRSYRRCRRYRQSPLMGSSQQQE